MRQSILFFSRSELTYLYGSMDKYLNEDFDIIHVAYSEEEDQILKNSFDINDSIIFKDIFNSFDEAKVSSLDIFELDTFFLKNTNGRFNLNGALQANRTGEFLSYEENVLLAKTYYLAWQSVFNKRQVDYFIHEPVSLLMNQMAACFCVENNVIYSTHILVRGLEENQFSFVMVDGYKGIPTVINKNYHLLSSGATFENEEMAKEYISNFRKSFQVFFSQLGNGKVSIIEYTKLFLSDLRLKLAKKLKRRKFDSIVDNIEVFIDEDSLVSRRVKNIKQYNHIVFDELDERLNYYFYPIHLEPEAVVLYWADNKYTNQIKLIENIAAQLPPYTYLYVKDHPHLIGYRNAADYQRLKKLPNVKLLRSDISGKDVVKHCKGVITINGTAGFEALVMGKNVITLGSSYYGVSKNVICLDNVFDLREKLYELEQYDSEENKENELKRFICAFLKSTYPGFTDFYGGMHKKLELDLDINGRTVAESLKNWVNDRKIVS